MRLTGIGVLALTLICGAAIAEPINGKAAKRALFSPKGASVELTAQGGLSATDIAALRQVALQQKYYGAVAMAPAEGLVSASTVAATNYHGIEAASLAALATCNAKREKKTPCVVVALIRPADWAARDLQLSVDATDDFRRSYLRAPAPKAFAISPETGRWAVAKGEGAGDAAVSACNERAAQFGGRDCALVILD